MVKGKVVMLLLAVIAVAIFLDSSKTFNSGEGVSGQQVRAQISPTEVPIISYYTADDGTTGKGSKLYVATCNNAICSNGATSVHVDGSQGNASGIFNSLKLGSDDLPIISYSGIDPNDHDSGSGPVAEVKVLKCGNKLCTSGNIITTIEEDAAFYHNYFGHTSTVIGSDGLPIIAYIDYPGTGNGDEDLKVAKCRDTACTNSQITLLVHGDVNSQIKIPSMAMGSNGLPILAYMYNSNFYALKCGNHACSSGNTITNLQTSQPNRFSFITIGSDGLPLIVYQTSLVSGGGTVPTTENSVWALKCGNHACSSGNVKTRLDSKAFFTFLNEFGYSLTVSIGSDGLPILAYADHYHYLIDYYPLKVLKCGNHACSSGNTITRVEAPKNYATSNGAHTVEITQNNENQMPLIAYFNVDENGKGDLKVLKCGNQLCNANNIISVLVSGSTAEWPGYGGVSIARIST